MYVIRPIPIIWAYLLVISLTGDMRPVKHSDLPLLVVQKYCFHKMTPFRSCQNEKMMI